MELRRKMEDWSFSDPTLAKLPMDPEQQNFVRRNVPKVIFSPVRPTPFEKERKLVAYRQDRLFCIQYIQIKAMSMMIVFRHAVRRPWETF